MTISECLDHILLTLLIVFTCACLWFRRWTWRSNIEKWPTRAAALFGAGMILTSPHAKLWLNPLIPHFLTGGHPWSQTILGHCLNLVGLGIFTATLVGHVDLGAYTRKWFLGVHLGAPAHLAPPLITAFFWTDHNALVALIITSLYMWIHAHALLLLVIIWIGDKRAKAVTSAYLIAAAIFTVALVARIYWQTTGMSIYPGTFWRFATIATLVFMFGATLSWQRKRRELKHRMWLKISKQKPVKRLARPASDPPTERVQVEAPQGQP